MHHRGQRRGPGRRPAAGRGRALWANPSVQQIIDYIDTNYELRSDMTAQARITTKDPDQGTKVIESVLLPPGQGRRLPDRHGRARDRPGQRLPAGGGQHVAVPRATPAPSPTSGVTRRSAAPTPARGTSRRASSRSCTSRSLDAAGQGDPQRGDPGRGQDPGLPPRGDGQGQRREVPQAGDVGDPGQVPGAEARVLQPLRHAAWRPTCSPTTRRSRAATCRCCRSSPTRWRRGRPPCWRSRASPSSKVDDYKFDKSYLESLSK